MDSIIFDKPLSNKDLSNILEAYVDKYNRSSPAPGASRYESLFVKAAEYYYIRRPYYYEALNRCFDKDHNLAFVDDLEKRLEKNYAQYSIDPLDKWVEHDDYDKTVYKYVDLYMKGQYCIIRSATDYNINEKGELVVHYPDAVYYALARMVGMPEENIYNAFSWGDSLNVRFYIKNLIKDVCTYFFQKNVGSFSELAKIIGRKHATGYSYSTLRNLILEWQEITHEQFAVLAEALKIPSWLVEFCQYRIAEYSDQFANISGYKDALLDVKEDPEEFYHAYLVPVLAEHLPMYKVFNLYDRAAKLYAPPEKYISPYRQDKEDIFYKFYRNKGFSFEPYTGDEELPENHKEAWLLNFAKMYVTLPNGRKELIDTDRYLAVINKAVDYALYLMWKKTGGPEKSKDKDSE